MMWLCQEKDSYVQDKSFAHMGLNYDDGESTPLWRCIHERQWDLVKEEIKKKPCQAQIWMYRTQSDDRSKLRWRLLPLHACLIFKCPDSILKEIIEAYPEGCRMKDDQNQLPIHLASKKHNACDNYDLLLMLVDAYPDGLAIKGKRGMLPRDILQDNINRMTLSLATVDPEGRTKSKETDNEPIDAEGMTNSNEADGEQLEGGEASTGEECENVEANYDLNEALPLYDCIRTKQWVKVKEMAEETPQQARTWVLQTEVIDGSKQQRRILPLHAAIMFNCPRAVLKIIVSAYPDGAKKQDDQSQLPIHIAIKHHTIYGDEVFSMLVEAYPDSVGVRDELGMTPHDLLQDSISMMKMSVGILSVSTTNQIPASRSGNKKLPQHAKATKGAHDTKHISRNDTDDMILENPPTNMKEVNYDSDSNTPLFKSIQSLQWSRVKEIVAEDPQQTQIWTYRMETRSPKKLRWKMLPLHASIIFKCPNRILKIITEAFPEASLMKDDRGCVPLQLARKKHNAYDDYDDDALDLLVKAMRSVAFQNTKYSDHSEDEQEAQDGSQRQLSPTATLDHEGSVINAAERARMSSILQEDDDDDTVVLMEEEHEELVEEGDINRDEINDTMSGDDYVDTGSTSSSRRASNSIKKPKDPLLYENNARPEHHADFASKSATDTVNGQIGLGNTHSTAEAKSRTKESHKKSFYNHDTKEDNCNEISPKSVCTSVYGTHGARFSFYDPDAEKGEDTPLHPSKLLVRSIDGKNENCSDDLINEHTEKEPCVISSELMQHKPSNYMEDAPKTDCPPPSDNDQQSSLSNPSVYEGDVTVGNSEARNDDYISDASYDDSEDDSSYVEALNQWIQYSNQRGTVSGRNTAVDT